MLLVLSILFLLSFMLVILFTNLMDNSYMKSQKFFEFECGFNSITINRLPFSLQYFMISIMFLVFDLEIIILLPFILEGKMDLTSYVLASMFIIILTLGLFLEWFLGLIEWIK